MNNVWQLQEAKSRLSELVQNAEHRGAQTITRHGRAVAVVLSAEAYSRLQPRRKTVDILRECPEPGLLVERLRDTPRTVATRNTADFPEDVPTVNPWE